MEKRWSGSGCNMPLSKWRKALDHCLRTGLLSALQTTKKTERDKRYIRAVHEGMNSLSCKSYPAALRPPCTCPAIAAPGFPAPGAAGLEGCSHLLRHPRVAAARMQTTFCKKKQRQRNSNREPSVSVRVCPCPRTHLQKLRWRATAAAAAAVAASEALLHVRLQRA